MKTPPEILIFDNNKAVHWQWILIYVFTNFHAFFKQSNCLDKKKDIYKISGNLFCFREHSEQNKQK